MEFEGSCFQKRIWLEDKVKMTETNDGEWSACYNIPLIFKIDGLLNIEFIRKTLKSLLEKHEVLKTNILMKDENIIQDIKDEVEPMLEMEDWSNDNKTYEEVISYLKEMNARAFKKGIDNQLFKSFYLKVNDKISFFLVTIHHCICDNVSKDILKKDIINFYTAIENGREPEYEEIMLQYADFSEWQNELSDEILENHIMYWKRKLKNEIQPLVLPIDHEKVENNIYNLENCTIILKESLIKKINQLHLEYDFNKRDIFLAIFKILMMKYLRKKEICFGTSITKRINDDLLNTVGPISNLALLSDELDEKSTFIEIIKQISETYEKAEEHSIIPFEKLITEIRNSTNTTNLVDIIFNYIEDKDVINESKFKEIEMNIGWGRYGYNILIKESKSEIKLYLTYDAGCYNEETTKQLANNFIILSEILVEHPDKTIEEIDVVNREEKEKILNEFNDTAVIYSKNNTVVSLFEEQASRVPNKTAVIYYGKEITYSELNQKANELAVKLRQLGIKPDDYVAVMAEKRIETIIGICGIIKAGAAYVPIDTTYPNERIDYMLGDCKPKALLLYDKEYETDIPVVDISEAMKWKGIYENIQHVNKTSDLIYLIYTSGTTGKPKGVMVEHKSIIRLVHKANYVELNENTVMLQTGSLSFDAATLEIWGPLLNGGKLYLANNDIILDAKLLKRVIEENGINTMWLTASLFNQLIDSDITIFDCLDTLLFGGEKASETHVRKVIAANKNINLINGYGPTETTTFATTYLVNNKRLRDRTPIGKPISNTKVYVLNGLKLCGIGMIGELCIAGDGVARGYLNHPELTAEKFIDNPFGEGKIYRSGDLVRWLPDGNIEYLGRIDEQIKLRGFRIELSEIENVIKKQEGIQDAAVILREKDGEKYICAYLVSENNVSTSEFRNTLEKNLPNYMVPSYIMQIEKIPVTTNGKLDRKSLPKIEAKSEKEYIAPRNETEKIFVKVFEEILGINKIGIKDNFFELGGDSIKAIRIVSKLRELDYKLTTKDLMQLRSIEKIIKTIRKIEKEIGYNQDEITGEVPLTPIQNKFFEWNLLNPNHFNQSIILKSKNEFEEKSLRESLKALVVHHDILRATFKNGKQEIYGSSERNLFTLDIFDFMNIDGKILPELINKKSTEIQSSMDLTNGPLMKAVWYKTFKYDYLVICIHHLVIDGVSWRILIEDLKNGYKQYITKKEIALPKKTASYKEWATALLDYSKSKELEKEESYWNEVESKIEKGKIEADAHGNEEGNGITMITFSELKTRELLYEVVKAYNTEINDILLAALGMSAKLWKNKKKLAVNLEGHGREEINKVIDINRTVGWFTSIYPIIIEISEEIEDIIVQTKEMLRHVPNHGIGYGVIRHCKKYEAMQEADISFNYLGEFNNENKDDEEISMAEMLSGRDSAEENKLSDSITLNGSILAGKLIIEIEYDKNKYSKESIEKFADYYKISLTEMIEHCISKKEHVKTASDFNAALTNDVLKEIMDIF